MQDTSVGPKRLDEGTTDRGEGERDMRRTSVFDNTKDEYGIQNQTICRYLGAI